MRSAARVAVAAALSVALRAGALAPALAQSAPAAGTLTLSPRTFDGDSGLLQLDVKVSPASPGSRMLVAFRCAPRETAFATQASGHGACPLPRSSAESAPVASSCLFEHVLLATSEQDDALRVAVNSSSDDTGGDCAASGQCAPSLSATCGFAVQRIQADGSCRCAAASAALRFKRECTS